MEILKDYISTYYGIILLLIAVSFTLVRYSKLKRGDNGDISKDEIDKFFRETRASLFATADNFATVVQAERFGGRKAAKAEINDILIKYVKESSLLKDYEKSVILKFDLSFIVNEIEEELIKSGLLSSNDDEPTQ